MALEKDTVAAVEPAQDAEAAGRRKRGKAKGGRAKGAKAEKAAAAGRAKGKRTIGISDFILAVHHLTVVTADARIFSKNGVTLSEWAMLKTFDGKNEMSLADATKGARISRQRAGKVLSDLEKKGLITIANANARDKRTRAIAVLPKAAKAIAGVEQDFSTLSGMELLAKGGGRSGRQIRTIDKLAQMIRRNEVEARRRIANAAGRKKRQRPGAAKAQTPAAAPASTTAAKAAK